MTATAGRESGGAFESASAMAQAAGKVLGDLVALPLFGMLPGGIWGLSAVAFVALACTWVAAKRFMHASPRESSSSTEHA
mmetsp:Transcript_77959/g.233682  ORF Transcript_77959/g.233682 Transcript_77959/m.233682 type:complete len:80 (-) Transcript_77959:8-247(-)